MFVVMRPSAEILEVQGEAKAGDCIGSNYVQWVSSSREHCAEYIEECKDESYKHIAYREDYEGPSSDSACPLSSN